MPWYCRACGVWKKSSEKFCPDCGRAEKGRICRRCKEKVDNDATYCPACGSERLTDPVPKLPKPALILRIAAAAAVPVGLWLLVRALVPLIWRLLLWSLGVLAHLLIWLLVLWLLSGILPRPWRQALWKAAWGLVRLLARLIGRILDL